MNLVEAAMEDVTILEKVRTPDGEGGFETKYVYGPTIKAAITFNNSINARVAQVQGVKDVFTITTHKNAPLDFHDIVKRLSDGKFFRVTSNGNDRVSPAVASFQYSRVSAEEWEVPQ